MLFSLGPIHLKCIWELFQSSIHLHSHFLEITGSQDCDEHGKHFETHKHKKTTKI